MLEVVIASKNDGKIREIEDILKPANLKILTYKDFDFWPDVEETGSTFLENAEIKAKALVKAFGIPALADDSGLEVDALNGKPGVYSSRYAGEEGNSEKNNKKLLEELKDLSFEKRTARFRCIALILFPNGKTIVADGTLEGHIGFELKGREGFGYDPLFIPEGDTRTLAEMSLEEKNKISHRAKAFKILKDKIIELASEQKN